MSSNKKAEALRRVENAERELKEAQRMLKAAERPEPEGVTFLTAKDPSVSVQARVSCGGDTLLVVYRASMGNAYLTPAEARKIASKLHECADWVEGVERPDLGQAKEALHHLTLAATEGYLQLLPSSTDKHEQQVLRALEGR